MDAVERLDAKLVELIETDPLGALRVIRDVGDLCTARAKQAADAAVVSSTSWTDIGAALGVSKQAAHQRLSGTSPKLEEVLRRLDAAEVKEHAKIDRKMGDAREKIARHPQRERVEGIIAEKQEQAHEKVSERMDRARSKARKRLGDEG